MKFIVVGSGGCVDLPRPLCQCGVCVEARQKGFPYARCGCSLYLEDAALLVDTPEDISVGLNNADIREIKYIFYSHWDPDHTLGMRIVEQMYFKWLDYYEKIPPKQTVSIYAEDGVMLDISKIRNKYGSFLDYYRKMDIIERKILKNSVTLDNIKISAVPVLNNGSVSVFVFESKHKKLIYAPCDCKPFPESAILRNADVLLIGNTFMDGVLKDGRIIGENHPLRREMYSIDEVTQIGEKLGVSEIIITHIEEDWGKSYGDYVNMEKNYHNLKFAYDGMIIEL